jgi:Protein of unknown function (DUF1580)
VTDLLSEELLSLAEAAKRLSNHPHISTVWRWSLRGVRGVRLQTIAVGGRRYTTATYLEEFVAHLSGRHSSDSQPESKLRAQQKARAAHLAATTL